MGVGDIIAWIIMGALVGWIASMIMGTNARQGAVGNVVVGILGAFVGGFIMHLFDNSGASSTDAFSWRSFFVALLGAIVVLFLWRMVAGRGRGAGAGPADPVV
jgi:uncharacterized membrane protein YeaQ/YmgE (transglycosylase-associated protein family)